MMLCLLLSNLKLFQSKTDPKHYGFFPCEMFHLLTHDRGTSRSLPLVHIFLRLTGDLKSMFIEVKLVRNLTM